MQNLMTVKRRAGLLSEKRVSRVPAGKASPKATGCIRVYHRACIDYLASQGLARLALDQFHFAQECFPNVFDFNDIGAQLLLICGYPELALLCAEDSLLDSAEKAALVDKIRAAVDAPAKA